MGHYGPIISQWAISHFAIVRCILRVVGLRDGSEVKRREEIIRSKLVREKTNPDEMEEYWFCDNA